MERRKGRQPKFSYHFKIEVARAYIEGTESTTEIAKRFGLSGRTMVNNIYSWYKKNFPEEVNLPSIDKTENLPASKEVENRLAVAEKLLAAERIKAATLEKMIEIAEQELKIDIRKKSSTKQ